MPCQWLGIPMADHVRAWPCHRHASPKALAMSGHVWLGLIFHGVSHWPWQPLSFFPTKDHVIAHECPCISTLIFVRAVIKAKKFARFARPHVSFTVVITKLFIVLIQIYVEYLCAVIHRSSRRAALIAYHHFHHSPAVLKPIPTPSLKPCARHQARIKGSLDPNKKTVKN